jgi:hypothetical protein
LQYGTSTGKPLIPIHCKHFILTQSPKARPTQVDFSPGLHLWSGGYHAGLC